MNGKERALKAMKNQPVDHVPMTFFRHMETLTIDEQIDWYKKSGIDLICLENDGYEIYPMELSKNSVLDFKDIPRYTRDSSYVDGQIERVKRILDGIGGEQALVYLFYTPFSMLKHILGNETRIMEYWKEDKQTVIDAMAVMEEANYLLMRALKEETAVDGTLSSLQNAEIDRFAPEEYEDYLKRWDVSFVAMAKHFYEYNVFHLCSWVGVPNNLFLWKDLALDCVHWGVNIEKDLSLKQARSYFPEGTVIMGGFDNRPQSILYHGTKQQIKNATKDMIASAGAQGYIISADCSVKDDTPLERFDWIREASIEYAQGNK